MINQIISWWKRSVRVERADPKRDISFVKIDSADGSEPQEVYLSRNNTFAFCWVMNRAMSQSNGEIKDISVTISIPLPGGSKESYCINVPNWARRDLLTKLWKLSKEFGWDGRCPVPAPDVAYRS